MNVQDIIRLAEILGEMGQVKRVTKLPNGERESDSHHSFSLALVAYHIARTECPELDADKVLLYALAHDLLEIVTGDENTLHYTPEQHAAKQAKEEAAIKDFDKLFAAYPELRQAMHDYEKLDTPEAATVYVLDKACTTWTHHPDKGANARELHVTTKADVHAWSRRTREKFYARLKVMPPQAVLDVYEASFKALEKLYKD